ncbi:MAG: hypothetical protein A3B92_03295 [Candidatus Harrisonbacteria bacterium RIFCSPHIGHO2_02_FULL_42_16]|uniref:ABC transporter substrate-binding protein n=1 Tax=Candidatus Harrisonbacteria bacterium RIFCSPHIGHO2_02_FULL_42_16 TaxID=1798404 RepID=A0A1G1ZGA6_9BACT|nr:MAG: hypothetical protein A3B92_03295 [Candidatus Harrisonbacteria bacterium RIFCSPHIGHO2_02_FULL_42_16]
MNLTRSQLIIVGVAGAVLIIIALIALGVIPGIRIQEQKPPEITLTIWGVSDNKSVFQENLSAYEALRPNIRVNYEELNPDDYEKVLVNALAAGKGPDIMMLNNSWLPKHFDKLIPVKNEQLTPKSFQELFPVVAEQDFAPDGIIYAAPLYIDTLALFYNQDTFDKNGIAVAPKDWLDFQNLIPKLRQKDASGKIIKAAAAIGGSNNNIGNASDFLTLLMLQAGTKMTDDDFQQTTFANSVEGLFPARDALTFYAKFSNPNEDDFYTWNENFENSLDSFARGNTAMIFAYAGQKENIKTKNPFLNFKSAAMPQPVESEKAVNYPNYQGLAVTKNSQYPDWAWDLILYLTANETAAENYLSHSSRSPALRALIQKYAEHPELGVFAKQALSARSWPQIDKEQIAKIFSQMIVSAVTGQLSVAEAVNQADRQATELMRARR